MAQLTGDSSHVPEPWLKLQFSHDLQIVANIWDIVSTQVNKIYNTGLVVFGYFTAKFLHIAPLRLFFEDLGLVSVSTTFVLGLVSVSD